MFRMISFQEIWRRLDNILWEGSLKHRPAGVLSPDDHVPMMSRCVPDVLVLKSPSSQQCFSSNAQISVISFKISCPPYQTSWYHSLGFHLMTPYTFSIIMICLQYFFLGLSFKAKAGWSQIFFLTEWYSLFIIVLWRNEKLDFLQMQWKKTKSTKKSLFQDLPFLMPIKKKYVFSSSLICIFPIFSLLNCKLCK